MSIGYSGTADPGAASARSAAMAADAAAASAALAAASADAAGRQTSFPACDLCAVASGTAGNAVTLTLPAVAGKRHYIGLLQVYKFTAVPLTLALTTPPLITSSNVASTPSIPTSAEVQSVGVQQTYEFRPTTPIVSSVAATNTTFTMPAVAGVIWRAQAFYFTAP
jgi:hypothetical protein